MQTTVKYCTLFAFSCPNAWKLYFISLHLQCTNKLVHYKTLTDKQLLTIKDINNYEYYYHNSNNHGDVS